MVRLSVVTACWNHAQYLPECMESVQRQTVPVEHIVVIDGATDNSLAVAHQNQAEGTHLITNDRNRGLAYSQNAGIRLAQGEWVLKVDADDYIAPSYVEEILAAADADPRRNVIFSPCQHVGAQTHVYQYPPFDPARMIDYFMIPGPAAFRREVWDAVGGYDETMRSAEDWDLYIRAQLAVGLVPHQLAEPRWFYRMHSGPRASALGMAQVRDLKAYWRGHTRETARSGARSWGAWCKAKGLAA